MPFDDAGFLKEQETKPEPFTLEDLVAWLRTQDPEKRYCYADGEECLLGQYVTARDGNLGDDGYYYIGRRRRDAVACDPMQWAVRGDWNGSAHHQQTFGAALARAEKLLAERR